MRVFFRLSCILAPLLMLIPRGYATIQAAGVPVESCEPALSAVNRLDFPRDWRIIVVGEKLWAAEMEKLDHTSELSVTDRKQHITLIRAVAFTDPNLTGKYVTARHVLAHELGHIKCDCNDEWSAEIYANRHDH